VVGEDALVDLAGKVALQAADDFSFAEPIRGAAGDVIDGRLMEAHTHDDAAVKRRVGLAVTALVEAMPGRHRRRRRDAAGAAELR